MIQKYVFIHGLFCQNEASKSKTIFSCLCFQILNVEKLHMMLLASSVEIVIYAYATSHKFPWILECFNIDAFYFYKLIEIIVLNHEGILNRDLIKHLNAVSCKRNAIMSFVYF